jgi:hypothetical protein
MPRASQPTSVATGLWPVYSSFMTVVLNFDGKELPEEMRSLPSGRYVLQPVDEVPVLTAEEEAGLEEAARSLDRGEGLTPDELRAELNGIPRR